MQDEHCRNFFVKIPFHNLILATGGIQASILIHVFQIYNIGHAGYMLTIKTHFNTSFDDHSTDCFTPNTTESSTKIHGYQSELRYSINCA